MRSDVTEYLNTTCFRADNYHIEKRNYTITLSNKTAVWSIEDTIDSQFINASPVYDQPSVKIYKMQPSPLSNSSCPLGPTALVLDTSLILTAPPNGKQQNAASGLSCAAFAPLFKTASSPKKHSTSGHRSKT
ncbi:hypothetical protein AWENTII_004391 [Aspergillus wentii]